MEYLHIMHRKQTRKYEKCGRAKMHYLYEEFRLDVSV